MDRNKLYLRLCTYIKNDKLYKEWEDNKLKCELRNVLSINEGHSNGHKRETLQTRSFCNGNNARKNGIYGPNMFQ